MAVLYPVDSIHIAYTDKMSLEVLEMENARELVDSGSSTPGLSERVHAAVTDLIKSQKLLGGDIIVESRLADILGISRTPLREALQKLEGEGLVIKNGRSFVVRAVGLAEYLQSLKVREILEGEAAYLAAGKVPLERINKVRKEIDNLVSATNYLPEKHWQSDDDVHSLAIDHCGNAVLGHLIVQLRSVTRLYETLNLADRLERDASEHLAIISALENGDQKSARLKTQAHLRSLYKASI